MNPYAPPVLFLAIMSVIWLAFIALMMVSMWHIFVKMGIPGWKGIVPIYNLRVMISALKKQDSWFWGYILPLLFFMLVLGIMIGFLIGGGVGSGEMAPGSIGGFQMMSIFVSFFSIPLGISIVFSVLVMYFLAESFGYGAWFSVGLSLLPLYFLPVLAFGACRFQLKE